MALENIRESYANQKSTIKKITIDDQDRGSKPVNHFQISFAAIKKHQNVNGNHDTSADAWQPTSTISCSGVRNELSQLTSSKMTPCAPERSRPLKDSTSNKTQK